MKKLDAMEYLANGWAGLTDQTEEERKNAEIEAERVAAEQADIDDAIRNVMMSRDGKTLFNWLKSMTVDQPTWLAAVQNPDQAGYIREGQNSIYREMVNRAKRSEERERDIDG